MIVYNGIDELKSCDDITLILGNFDGLHLGHLELIKAGLSLGGKVIIATFEPHPMSLRNTGFKRIQTYEEKMLFLENTGIDGVLILSFSNEFASMDKDDFIKNILFNKLNVKNVVVGYDYRFGKGAKGTTKDLVEAGVIYGFNTVVIPAFKIMDKVVSSSQIRKFILNGDIESANQFLGRMFSLEGKVIKGHGIGRKIGFPTANLEIDINKLLPAPGVYSVISEVRDCRYQGFCNVGFQPTFDDRERQMVVEVNLFDFDDDIYDETVRVHFVSFIRKVKKFSSIDALVEELNIDKEKAIKDTINEYIIRD